MSKKLYQFKGYNLYDGCFWRWVFVYENNGKKSVLMFDNDIAEKILILLENDPENLYIYDLDNVEHIADFIEANTEDNVHSVAVSLSKFDIILEKTCQHCKEIKPIHGFISLDYRGCGGIEIENTNYICEDCFNSMTTCQICGDNEFIENVDNFDVCKNCQTEEYIENKNQYIKDVQRYEYEKENQLFLNTDLIPYHPQFNYKN